MHAYRDLWNDVVAATTDLGGRAWLFSLPPEHLVYTEFVEWPASADLPIIDRDPLRHALERLQKAYPSEDSATWQQAI